MAHISFPSQSRNHTIVATGADAIPIALPSENQPGKNNAVPLSDAAVRNDKAQHQRVPAVMTKMRNAFAIRQKEYELKRAALPAVLQFIFRLPENKKVNLKYMTSTRQSIHDNADIAFAAKQPVLLNYIEFVAALDKACDYDLMVFLCLHMISPETQKNLFELLVKSMEQRVLKTLLLELLSGPVRTATFNIISSFLIGAAEDPDDIFRILAILPPEVSKADFIVTCLERSDWQCNDFDRHLLKTIRLIEMLPSGKIREDASYCLSRKISLTMTVPMAAGFVCMSEPDRKKQRLRDYLNREIVTESVLRTLFSFSPGLVADLLDELTVPEVEVKKKLVNYDSYCKLMLYTAVMKSGATSLMKAEKIHRMFDFLIQDDASHPVKVARVFIGKLKDPEKRSSLMTSWTSEVCPDDAISNFMVFQAAMAYDSEEADRLATTALNNLLIQPDSELRRHT